MGQTFFNALVKYCRTDEGYAALSDVRSKQKRDSMESFFFAETLKYLYLLYAPESTPSCSTRKLTRCSGAWGRSRRG
jgi:hypothetical protein